MLKNKKLAVLGAGKLGETLIKGLLEAGVIDVANVRVTAGHQQRLDQILGESACGEQARPPPGLSHRIFESSRQRTQETSGDRLFGDAVIGKTDRAIGNFVRKGTRR